MDIIGYPIGSSLNFISVQALKTIKEVSGGRGVGFRRNPERERLVYQYWAQGYTIDEISMLTGIPRSSVGYYVRKFNKRYGRDGRSRRGFSSILMDVDESPEMNEDKAVESVVTKMISLNAFFDIVGSLIREERYRDLYYLLKSMKLMSEILRPLMPTSEEKKVAVKAPDRLIQLFIDAVKLKRQLEGSS